MFEYTAPILLVAVVLDAVVGDPEFIYRRVPHPVVLIGRVIGALDGQFRRVGDSPRALLIKGALAAFLCILFFGFLGQLLHVALVRLPFSTGLEAVVVAMLLAGRSLSDHVLRVARGLDLGLAEGRAAVFHLVGRDPESLDYPGVCRAAIESLAENASDGWVAPALWYLFLGLPGLFAYKAINTLDSMIGYRNERYEQFGKFAALVDDAANWVPARVTGWLLVFAAGIVEPARAGAALATIFRDASQHRSPNAGWPEAAMAGALGIRLAGPRQYAHGCVDDPWMGHGAMEAGVEHIRKGLALYWAALSGLTAIVAILVLI